MMSTNERTSLFIDGFRTHNAVRDLGFDIDFKRLLAFYRERTKLVRAYYYTQITTDEADVQTVRPLVDWLQYNGFTIVEKPRRPGATLHVEMSVDALRSASTLDHIVIFSGDSNYTALIADIKRIGVRTSVVSTLVTRPSHVADELRRVADHFVDLTDLRDAIARPARVPMNQEAAE